MFLLSIAPHIITMLLCLFVIIYSAFNLRIMLKDRIAKKIQMNAALTPFLQVAAAIQIVVMIVFILMQLDWIINDYDNSTSTVTSVGWWMYDIFNTLTHLTIALAIRVYIKWELNFNQCVNYVPSNIFIDTEDIVESVRKCRVGGCKDESNT